MKTQNNIKLPTHISIIMDGNGRWAKKRFLPRMAGHKAGSTALRKLVEDMNEMGLKYLSVYAFSTENWKRDTREVTSLMNLLRGYISDYLNDTDKNNIKLTIIGDTAKLDEDLQISIKNTIEKSKNNTGLNLIVAINYGGRDEIVRAIKKMMEQKTVVTEENFEKFLDTYKIPDPEILIRTSGEQRLSNFLLWQTAYTEFYYTDTLWPDFTKEDLLKAVEDFNGRDRRFGGV